jgi:hypothetical protein
MAVTICSPLCSVPYVFPLWISTTGCPFSSVSRKHATCRKAHVTISLRTNEHPPTAVHRYTIKRIEAYNGNCSNLPGPSAESNWIIVLPNPYANSKPNTELHLPLQFKSANELTISLSSYLLDCLVRYLNYGPWLVIGTTSITWPITCLWWCADPTTLTSSSTSSQPWTGAPHLPTITVM